MTTGPDIGDGWRLFYLIESFASLAAARGDFRRTTRLWDAAEALREGPGSSILLHDRSRHKHDLAAALTQLGESVFQTEHAVGRVLSRDKAIAYTFDKTLKS